MERLTKRLDDGQTVTDCESCELREQNCGPLACRNRLKDRLAAYEDTGLEPEEIVAAENLKHNCKIECLLKKYNELSDMIKELGPVDHIRELVQAEQDGRLLVLPCKRGDKVWRICGPKGRKFVAERIVSSVTIYGPGTFEVFTNTSDWLGKTVFLTREEAEAALKGGAE